MAGSLVVVVVVTNVRGIHTHLIFCGSSYSDPQTTTSDWFNHLALTVAAQNESTGTRILFHGATQGCLRLTTQLVHIC
jgi:hypothetical protein